MQQGATAIVKDDVRYGTDNGAKIAPNGVYEIEKRESCVGFCECSGECDFTLSFDAFRQYVAEGRIAIRA